MFRDLTEDDLASVVLRREALAAGYDDRAIRRLVKSGTWQRVRHGAYVPTDVWGAVSPQSQHRLLARAVLKVAHHSAVLSHVTAAVELGAPTWGVDLSSVHLTRRDGQTGRQEAGVIRHVGALADGEVIEANGAPVTNGTRAALEATTVASLESALVIVNGLLFGMRTTLEKLREAAPTMQYWPNSLTTRLVLALADPRISSAGESRLYYLLWKARLPLPTPQVYVTGLSAAFRAYVDFAWPELGVFLEFDGREKYVRFRRDGETLEQYLLREKRREELICQLTGWVCIRITWADLAHPARTASRIRDILSSRGRVAAGIGLLPG
jgi:hypothetical protein